jgi:hypothetical protein
MRHQTRARDILIHFFEDAYHLKERIKNDPTTSTSDDETAINSSLPLSIWRNCQDL